MNIKVCVDSSCKEEDKRQYRDAHWQTDLQNAYELGKRLVGMAKGK